MLRFDVARRIHTFACSAEHNVLKFHFGRYFECYIGPFMSENVQAHQGQVTFLRVSHCDQEATDSLASRDHLVSCGTDHVVRVWQVIHVTSLNIQIQQKTSVKLLQLPTDVIMVGNTLCLTMEDCSVVMCRYLPRIHE